MDESPLLAVSIGDAAGIGPEVILAALADEREIGARLVVFGSLEVLRRTDAKMAEVRPGYRSIADRLVAISAPDAAPEGAGRTGVVDVVDDFGAIPWGRHDPRCARLQYDAFRAAMEVAARGAVDGIVTAPWNKSLLATIDLEPTGHTELLAERFDAPGHVMMLAGPRLRVSLVTTHLALSEVPAALDRERIVSTVCTTAREMHRLFGLERPRLAVCALNPHGGEGGIMGDEEQTLIAPAVEAARRELGDEAVVAGPLPADTLFGAFAGGDAPHDAVVCMYHDQGLIPLKLMHFGSAANLTLGLPIVRGSVDHGTAYDIAGRGLAAAGSMRYALELTASLARRARRRGSPATSKPSPTDEAP